MTSFLIALAAAATATWVCREIAVRLGIVNMPNPLVAQHVRPVAYLGGIGLAIGWAVAMLATGTFPPAGWGVGAAGALLLGLADDLRPFSPGAKLAAQLAVAILAVIVGMPFPALFGAVPDTIFAILAIVTLMNAVNLTDVSDGLVAGLALIAFGCLALLSGGPQATVLAAGAGAAGGFLVWNRPPASIFLGDAGSHLIGFVLAAAVLGACAADMSAAGWARAWLPVGVFVFELMSVIAMRYRRGVPVWRGSMDHFSLRLQERGWTRWQVDLAAWGACLCLCVLAIAAPLAGVALAGLAGLLAWHGLSRSASVPGEPK